YSFSGSVSLVFREDVVGDAHIFRLAFQQPEVVCDQVLTDACKTADLKGITFKDAAKRRTPPHAKLCGGGVLCHGNLTIRPNSSSPAQSQIKTCSSSDSTRSRPFSCSGLMSDLGLVPGMYSCLIAQPHRPDKATSARFADTAPLSDTISLRLSLTLWCVISATGLSWSGCQWCCRYRVASVLDFSRRGFQNSFPVSRSLR